MRQRAGLFLLALSSVAFLLFALLKEQRLLQERVVASGHAKALAHQVESLEKKLLDGEREKQAACQKWSEIDGQLRQANNQFKAFLDKVELVQGSNASRDQALQSLTGELEVKLDELSGGLGEIKKSLLFPKTGIVSRLEELALLKDGIAQLSSQVTALDAKLKANESLLAAERDRRKEEARQRDAELSALRKELESLRKQAPPPLVREDEKLPPSVPVSTTVEAAEPSTGAVVLGAGKMSGLEPGHVLSVTREGKPIARVKVLKVYDDIAGAVVLEVQSGESIQKNDRAETESPKTASRQADPAPGRADPALPLKKTPPPPPLPGGGAGEKKG